LLKKTAALILFLLVLALLIPLAGYDAKSSGGKDQDILALMDQMTLEEKVGQLFIVHVYGKSAEDPNYEQTNLEMKRGGKNFKEIIEKYHVGGIIYFNWTDNIGTPADLEQVNALSNDLQKIAMGQKHGIPLFIATDQEGGIVQRLKEPGTVFPGNMALGAARSSDLAYQSAAVLGKELMSLGINMNFAPVLDVNVNYLNPVIGVRSFGEDPDLVAKLGVSQVRGYQDQGILTTAKHFPGHGDTDVDSHYGLPIIHHDPETLKKVDLKPFQAAIEAGTDAIMTAHIVVPALDGSGLPATLSRPILTGLLREEMGFEGLIITDSLGMSGANVLPPEEVPVQAFLAGNDILLNPPDVELAYQAVLKAVKEGRIAEERLNESVYRILKVKKDKGLFENPYVEKGAIHETGSEKNLNTAKKAAEQSITLVKNENRLLPLKPSTKVFVTGPSSGNPEYLAALLREKGYDAEAYATAASPTAEQIDKALELSAPAGAIIVTTYNADTNEAQKRLVAALKESGGSVDGKGKPVAVAAVRNPYDLLAFPEVDAYLATYGNLNVSLDALARVLAGEVNPIGKLPVTIPNLFEYGHFLSYVDVRGLQQLIAKAKSIANDDGRYTVPSFQALQTAIGKAEEALPFITTEEKLKEETAKLQKAIDDLADLTPLERLIEKAKSESVRNGTYTKASVEALKKAIAAAEKALPELASKEEITREMEKLQAALDGLADLTPLKQLIEKAKSINNADGKYTRSSFDALQKAIAAAEKALETAATNAEISREIAKLQAALDGLVESSAGGGNGKTPSGQPDGGKTPKTDGDEAPGGGEQLPKTATNLYGLLAAGILLILAAGENGIAEKKGWLIRRLFETERY